MLERLDGAAAGQMFLSFYTRVFKRPVSLHQGTEQLKLHPGRAVHWQGCIV